MEQGKIIQDYYGDLYYLNDQKDREITIFIVDDNEIYRNLLEEKLGENPNFWIHSYGTGEECLRYLDLKPDLILLDYHLDSINPRAQKGDAIHTQIKERFPDIKVIMISSDIKLDFLSYLNGNENIKIMRKDGYTLENIYLRLKMLQDENKNNTFGTFVKVALFIIFPLFSITRMFIGKIG